MFGALLREARDARKAHYAPTKREIKPYNRCSTNHTIMALALPRARWMTLPIQVLCVETLCVVCGLVLTLCVVLNLRIASCRPCPSPRRYVVKKYVRYCVVLPSRMLDGTHRRRTWSSDEVGLHHLSRPAIVLNLLGRCVPSTHRACSDLMWSCTPNFFGRPDVWY